jgi:heme exporter protein B
LAAFRAVLGRDLRLARAHRDEALEPLFFLLLVVVLFPLGVGPSREILARIAPGVLWIACLLASLLALDQIFRADFDDGTLEQMVLSPHPLPLLVLAKVLAHWLVTGLPMLLLAPLLALSLALPTAAWPALLATLALGTPLLSLLGAIGTALTVGLRRARMLVPLLILPLYLPVLIFAAGAVAQGAAGLPYTGPLYLLGALLAFGITLAPLATAAALRLSQA